MSIALPAKSEIAEPVGSISLETPMPLVSKSPEATVYWKVNELVPLPET